MHTKTLFGAALVAALMTSAAMAAGTMAPPAGHMSLADHFAAADANHDGKVTKAEWDAYSKTRFAKLDANHDGKLSLDEAKAGGTHGAEKMFKDADKNTDGSLTEQEYVDGAGAHFAKFDTDGDHALSKAEQDAAVASMKPPATTPPKP